MQLQSKKISFDKTSLHIISSISCFISKDSIIYRFAGLGFQLDKLQNFHLEDAIAYCKVRNWNDCKLTVKEILERAYGLKK